MKQEECCLAWPDQLCNETDRIVQRPLLRAGRHALHHAAPARTRKPAPARKASDAGPAVQIYDATGATDTSSAATREGHAIEKSSPSRERFGL